METMSIPRDHSGDFPASRRPRLTSWSFRLAAGRYASPATETSWRTGGSSPGPPQSACYWRESSSVQGALASGLGEAASPLQNPPRCGAGPLRLPEDPLCLFETPPRPWRLRLTSSGALFAARRNCHVTRRVLLLWDESSSPHGGAASWPRGFSVADSEIAWRRGGCSLFRGELRWRWGVS